MPCYSPMLAWRTPTDGILLGKKRPQDQTSTPLALPCNKCTGCRQRNAGAWTLRCFLEMQQHRSAAFITLTYDEQHRPPTLEKYHLQLWLKRLRKRIAQLDTGRTIRFFACGEYGEKTNRPHYHAILFGGRESDRPTVDKAWGLGRTQTVRATPKTIAYVAGYVAKKYEALPQPEEERVDPTTGEVYTYQPPFLQMSQGIARHARDKHIQSWRDHAVYNGDKLPVPRYLHAAWEAQATPQQIQQLREERLKLQTKTLQQLMAAEKIANARRAINADKRKL